MIELTEFERTSNEYGPKLEFTVEGDHDEFEEKIDNCQWKGETFHKNLYGSRWQVDRSPAALDAIEREVGVELDRSVLIPDDPISMRIDKGSMFIELVEVSDGVMEILEEELSYEEEYWDNNANKKRTYKKDVIFDEGIPIGLKHKVEELLDDLGANYMMPDYREQPDLFEAQYEWNFQHELRDYQKYGVSKMMQGSRVIQFPTGAGKTVTALRTVYEMGIPTLILVHQLDLLEQWKRKVEEVLGVTPGIVQGDTEEYRDITIASIDTLSNRIEDRGDSFVINDFDLMVTDEVHHLKADTWLDVALHTDAYYRYGLSATVTEGLHVDGEGIKIVGGIGPNDVKVTPGELISKGHLAKPEFEWIYPSKIEGYSDWDETYKEGIVRNPDRNGIIAERAKELLDEGRRVLVDVNQIEHGERLLSQFGDALHREMWHPDEDEDIPYEVTFDPNMCASWPIPVVHNNEETVGHGADGDMLSALRMAVEETDTSVVWVCGEDDTDIRSFILQEFRRGEIDGVVSTLLREGTDVPKMDAVVLAGGGKSATQLIQTVGRALRPEGADDALIVDCKDVGEYVSTHTRKRYKAMKEYYGEYCDNAPLGL